MALCVTKGQVFRWQERDGGWIGVDGDRVLWLRQGDGLEFSTFPEPNRQDWVSEFFQLDVRLDSVERIVLETEPDLAGVVQRFPGLRVVRWNDAEECLFSFLCSVNNHIPRISSMISKLAAGYGTPLAEGLNRFPNASRIAEIPEAELRELGFGYRARTIVNAARFLVGQSDGWLSGMRVIPYTQAHVALQAIPGVGRKVADCVCLFGLGHSEAAPVDTHLWQASCERYFPHWIGRTLTEKRYEAVSQLFRKRWGRWAGWAHQYVFYERLFDKGSARRAGG